MTEAQKRFCELERKKEEIKKYFQDLQQVLTEVANEVGVGGYFQDPTDGTVFKVVVPDGKFVTFEKLGYVRTRRTHEKRGDLAIKDAEAAGFSVPTK